MQAPLCLTTEPEIITLPPTLFIYREKTGPFMQNAPLAWREFWSIAGDKFGNASILDMAGLGWIDGSKHGDAAFIYQAGIVVESMPETLPEGLQIRSLPQSKYAAFLLTGPYTQLADAYPAVFAILAKTSLQIRDDFCMERYLNNPMTTPPEQLQTKILIPLV